MMAELCGGCYSLLQDACGATLYLPAPSKSVVVAFVITDKFGNTYYGTGAVTDGHVTIQRENFPDGIFSQYAGKFSLVYYGTNESGLIDTCSPLEFEVCETIYDCLSISFVSATLVESVTPPPPPDCICQYAFGIGDYKVRHLFGDVLVNIGGEFTGTSSGNLISVNYSVEKYVAGVLSNSFAGTVLADDLAVVNVGALGLGITLCIRLTFNFDDAAICYESELYEIGATMSEKWTSPDEPLATVSNCNEGVFELSALSIGGTGLGSLSPYWIDGNLVVLGNGMNYGAEVAMFPPPATFDIALIYGINLSDWTGLPATFNIGTIGIASHFGACE
jgi:hypothetical protein